MYDRYLLTFIEIADCKSFTQAAEKLHLSSSAIMRQMNILEERLGFRLFRRARNGVFLTEAGRVFYQNAKFIIRYSEQTIQEARNTFHKDESICIGTSTLNPIHPVLQLIRKVVEKNPSLHIDVITFDDEYESLMATVRDLGNKMDLYFGLYPTSRYNGNCSALHLKDIPMTVSMAVNHPFALKKELDLDDLKGKKLIMIQRGDTLPLDQLRDKIDVFYREIEVINVPKYDLDTFNFCEKMNMLMISCALWEHVHPLMVNVPLKGAGNVLYGIVYSNFPSMKVKNFLRYVQEVLEDASEDEKNGMIRIP